MNIIFAVTANVAKPYEMFSPLVKGSTVGVLSKDSSNIGGLLKEQYQVSHFRSEPLLYLNCFFFLNSSLRHLWN